MLLMVKERGTIASALIMRFVPWRYCHELCRKKNENAGPMMDFSSRLLPVCNIQLMEMIKNQLQWLPTPNSLECRKRDNGYQ